jgi:hypothetical protein
MSDPDYRLVEFNRLNPVGKMVFVAGSVFKTLGAFVDFTVGAIGTVWDEAEKAFEQGKSDQIEDAVILDEEDRPRA